MNRLIYPFLQFPTGSSLGLTWARDCSNRLLNSYISANLPNPLLKLFWSPRNPITRKSTIMSCMKRCCFMFVLNSLPEIRAVHHEVNLAWTFLSISVILFVMSSSCFPCWKDLYNYDSSFDSQQYISTFCPFHILVYLLKDHIQC